MSALPLCMLRVAALLVGCAALMAACGDGSRATKGSAPQSGAPSLRVGLSLLDGAAFRQDGARFRILVSVVNDGAAAVALWPISSPEGARSASLVLSARGQTLATLHPPAVERSGAPASVDTPPGSGPTIEFDLSPGLGGVALPAGTIEARAVFENSVAAAMGVTGVWTGRVESPPARFEALPPSGR